ncbi:MAG: hypothetical protein KZQ99_18585 [Candidatus Thiodiazotropha sp. (ex Dulcina madagascariensis)]|nr:hypothetical protein [Candidatus Thiodiazotropha sp. (ex Dulcina madagascariensis)]
MNIMDLVTDPYNRRARLQPALFTMLPVLLVGLLLYPDVETRAATFLSILAYFGGSILLTQLGRERGKKIEHELYDTWGGKPSVALVRHRDKRLNSLTKLRYRRFLQENVPHFELPSREDEGENPTAADDMYQAATDWLLSKTRDKAKYHLIFEENMNYGYRRNLYALKPIALILDFILGTYLFIVAAVRESFLADDILQSLTQIDSYIYIAFAVVILHVLAMIFIVIKAWVKTTADAYGQQLLAACDILS